MLSSNQMECKLVFEGSYHTRIVMEMFSFYELKVSLNTRLGDQPSKCTLRALEH